MPNAYNIDTAEDITGQAGWMFSDMLVALMVVFLATISFIPQFASDFGSGTGTGTNGTTGGSEVGNYIFTEHYQVVFANVYSADSAAGLTDDVATFLKQNGIPTTAVIDSAQIVGGFDEKTETASDAIARATKFAGLIDARYPTLLEHASTIINSSTNLAANEVTVRLTFSSNVTTNH